ncbi:precorrin-6y C5,15-methyltransferase (decarboxylating) subunit CbiE [Thermoplasma sp. Kam2015]|uniref:precorrin-6y C5,15-methyltransferase (decarboxylating) subunit CbiE n=1 Tax=Thermoplasma sp. Kam2015 TaxID=2094122 RepID=UPI00137B412B|nr:precorrin-6y C5,15-methyltransferase (decarboxylating) subunit CbiE [Thermoplasma sp. Kam2015]
MHPADNVRKVLIVSLSRSGAEVAARLASRMRSEGLDARAFCRYGNEECRKLDSSLKIFLMENLRMYDAAVMVMSLPGFYRIASEIMIEKNHDIPIVVVDDASRFAVAAASGHAGNSNGIASYVAGILGCTAVITDGIESTGGMSVENIARITYSSIANPECILTVNAAIANGDNVPVIFRSEKRRKLRSIFEDRQSEAYEDGPAIVITDRPGDADNVCYLIPDDISIGIGFNSRADESAMSSCIENFFDEAGLSWEDVDYISSIKDIPPDIIDGRKTRFIRIQLEDLKAIDQNEMTHNSPKAMEVFGIPGVAEPCALYSLGPASRLFYPFRPCQGKVTIAAARRRKLSDGFISFVGVGPSDPDLMTMKARKAIVSADIVAGYATPLDIARGLIWNKPKVVFHWKDQQRYVDQIVSLYRQGYRIAYLFTGDACFTESELMKRFTGSCRKFEIIPGISSVQAACSITGMTLEIAGIVSFHVTGDIETRKKDLIEALSDKGGAIVIPRPYDFMPRDIAAFLSDKGFGDLPATVIEKATSSEERRFAARIRELKDMEFSDLSIMVIGEPVIR